MPATDSHRDEDRGLLGHLLVAWQSSGDRRSFESLLAAASPVIESAASRTLRQHHVADPDAVDDVMPRVFDHLRRLPGSSAGERLVARFAPQSEAVDDGHSYVVWLTCGRAIDVVRDRRRGRHRARCFSEFSAAELGNAVQKAASITDDECLPATDDSPPTAACCRLHAVIPRLEPRQRFVVELLLEGKSPAAIACTLDVCEGTVSRLRSKAIASLRRLLAE